MIDLYELPNGWKWKKLGNLAEYINGMAFKPTDWVETGLPIIRIQNLNGSDEYNYFNGEAKDRYYVKDGDILISWSASLDVYKWNGGNAILNQHIFNTNIKLDVVDYDFFYHTIKYSLAEIMKNLHGVGMKHITKGKFENIDVPLPPLSEQQRIVSKLDLLFEKIDKSIALHQKNMDEADVFMGSVLNDVFGELEEKYDTTSLDTLSSFQNGFAFKSKEFNTDGLGLRVIRIGNVLDINKNPVFIDERKDFEKYLLKENDIVISMTGTRKKMDYLFVRVVDTNDSYLNQRVGKISSKDNSNHRYLYYYLQSNYFRDKIFEYETGTVNQGNISGKDIMNSKIPFLSVSIQKKVVKYLDEVSEKIEKLKSVQKDKMDNLIALKASILDKAFKGEL